MKVFTHQQQDLYYRVSGKGDPVFLLHGFLEDHQMWDDLIPLLPTDKFAFYTFDLPCHGKTRFTGDVCSMNYMAALLAEFCKTHHLEQIKVIGHSMGGYVGLELLKLYPVAHLALLHSNFWNDPPKKQNDRNRVIEIVKANKSTLISEAIPNLFSPENRTRCAHTIELLKKRAGTIPTNEIIAATAGMRDRLPQQNQMNQHQVSIIHGENDPIIPTALLNKELSQLSTPPPIFIIENSGHMSIWEQPQTLINCLKSILFS